MWESESEFMAETLEAGCIFDTLVDENGEQLVAWNWEVLEEKYPDVYHSMRQIEMDEIESVLSGMVDKGLLEMSFTTDDDGNMEAVYSLTAFGREYAKEMNLPLF